MHVAVDATLVDADALASSISARDTPITDLVPVTSQLVGLQALRAIAASMVLVHHTLVESFALLPGGRIWSGVVLAGAVGVDLFFVISGFIMLHSNWEQVGRPGAARAFVVRRLIRIFPLYWFCLAILLLAKGVGFYRNHPLTLEALFASFALLPSHDLLLNAAWTLVFEMYFYALFAVWIHSPSRRMVLIGLPVTAALVSGTASVLPASDVRDYLTNPIIFEFCYGMLLAAAFRLGGVRWSSRWILPAAVFGIAGACAWSTVAHPELKTNLSRDVRYVLWGIPAALVVASVLAIPEKQTPLWRVLRALGDSSYALYLSHGFVMTSYARLLKSQQLAALLPVFGWIVLVLVTAHIVGWFTHVLVERALARMLKPRRHAVL